MTVRYVCPLCGSPNLRSNDLVPTTANIVGWWRDPQSGALIPNYAIGGAIPVKP